MTEAEWEALDVVRGDDTLETRVKVVSICPPPPGAVSVFATQQGVRTEPVLALALCEVYRRAAPRDENWQVTSLGEIEKCLRRLSCFSGPASLGYEAAPDCTVQNWLGIAPNEIEAQKPEGYFAEEWQRHQRRTGKREGGR